MINEIFSFLAAISILLLLAGFYLGMAADEGEIFAKPALWSLGIGGTLLFVSLWMLSP